MLSEIVFSRVKKLNWNIKDIITTKKFRIEHQRRIKLHNYSGTPFSHPISPVSTYLYPVAPIIKPSRVRCYSAVEVAFKCGFCHF